MAISFMRGRIDNIITSMCFLGNYLTKTNQMTSEDCVEEDAGNQREGSLWKAPIPTTNAGAFSYEVKERSDNELYQVPYHVILN